VAKTLKHNSLTGMVRLIPPGDDDVPGPASDVVVLLDVTVVLDAVVIALEAYKKLRSALPSTTRLSVVPQHERGLLVPLGWSGYDAPLPGEAGLGDRVRQFLSDMELPETPVTDMVNAALNAATIVGGLRRAERGGNRAAPLERRAMEEALLALDRMRGMAAERLRDHPDLLGDLEALITLLETEGRPLSRATTAMETGDTDDVSTAQGLLLIEALCLDVDV